MSCEPSPSGCVVEFDDPDFARLGRDTVYYVWAIQEPSPAIHADPLRCEYDENGNCVQVNLCFGDYRTPADDDCLGGVSTSRAPGRRRFLWIFRSKLHVEGHRVGRATARISAQAHL